MLLLIYPFVMTVWEWIFSSVVVSDRYPPAGSSASPQLSAVTELDLSVVNVVLVPFGEF